nr:3-hydroxybutyryl-CoA dehydrogenase [Rhodococcus sp. JVH1]
MLESASLEDIDDSLSSGCAHPIGPLTLCGRIGLDIVLAITESLHAEFREQQHSPPPLLQQMVEAGRLGKKTGQGFYSYT